MNIQENKLVDLLGEYRCSGVESDNLNELKMIIKSVFIKNHVEELNLRIPYSHYVNYSEGNKTFLIVRLSRMIGSLDDLLNLLKTNIKHKMNVSKIGNILAGDDGLIDQIQDMLQIVYE
jgi:hypothetical protein